MTDKQGPYRVVSDESEQWFVLGPTLTNGGMLYGRGADSRARASLYCHIANTGYAAEFKAGLKTGAEAK